MKFKFSAKSIATATAAIALTMVPAYAQAALPLPNISEFLTDASTWMVNNIGLLIVLAAVIGGGIMIGLSRGMEGAGKIVWGLFAAIIIVGGPALATYLFNLGGSVATISVPG